MPLTWLFASELALRPDKQVRPKPTEPNSYTFLHPVTLW
jgi:hypothetical protein